MRSIILSAICAASVAAIPASAFGSSVRSHFDNSSMPVQSYLPSELSNDLNSSFLLKRAIVNFNEGDITTASMLLHRSLRTDPFNPIANYYMGLAKKRQGNMRRAVKYLKHANRVFANAPQSYAALGEVYAALGRIEDAQALITGLDSVKGASASDVQAAKTIIQNAIRAN